MQFIDYYGDSTIELCFPKEEFICMNDDCILVDGKFPRYSAVIDNNGNIIRQQYALGGYYVKVYYNPDYSTVHKLTKFILIDEVKVPRALWLNKDDMNITLFTIKTIVLFS